MTLKTRTTTTAEEKESYRKARRADILSCYLPELGVALGLQRFSLGKIPHLTRIILTEHRHHTQT